MVPAGGLQPADQGRSGHARDHRHVEHREGSAIAIPSPARSPTFSEASRCPALMRRGIASGTGALSSSHVRLPPLCWALRGPRTLARGNGTASNFGSACRAAGLRRCWARQVLDVPALLWRNRCELGGNSASAVRISLAEHVPIPRHERYRERRLAPPPLPIHIICQADSAPPRRRRSFRRKLTQQAERFCRRTAQQAKNANLQSPARGDAATG